MGDIGNADEKKNSIEKSIHKPQFKTFNLLCAPQRVSCTVKFKGNELQTITWNNRIKKVNFEQIYQINLGREWFISKTRKNEFLWVYVITFFDEDRKTEKIYIANKNAVYDRRVPLETWEEFEKTLENFAGISTKRPLRYYTNNGLEKVDSKDQ